MGALWQINYIITCAQNGWIYDAPFHLFQTDVWVAQDLWMVVLAVQFCLLIMIIMDLSIILSI